MNTINTNTAAAACAARQAVYDAAYAAALSVLPESYGWARLIAEATVAEFAEKAGRYLTDDGSRHPVHLDGTAGYWACTPDMKIVPVSGPKIYPGDCGSFRFSS